MLADGSAQSEHAENPKAGEGSGDVFEGVAADFMEDRKNLAIEVFQKYGEKVGRGH